VFCGVLRLSDLQVLTTIFRVNQFNHLPAFSAPICPGSEPLGIYVYPMPILYRDSVISLKDIQFTGTGLVLFCSSTSKTAQGRIFAAIVLALALSILVLQCYMLQCSTRPMSCLYIYHHHVLPDVLVDCTWRHCILRTSCKLYMRNCWLSFSLCIIFIIFH